VRNTNKSDSSTDYQMELVCVEQLVPQDHLLRVIHDHVDFSFITELTRPYYTATTGRPPIDPIVLFKMMLIGYLFNIRSERQLEKEIFPNAAYRWFLGLRFVDKVPDHSTISFNRNNRFAGTNLFQEIFEEVVRLAMQHHMVAGRVLITDSTHVRADANNNAYTVQVIEKTPHEYLEELHQAVNEDRELHEKKPLAPKEEVEVTKHKVSTTDPDCGFMNRRNKPEGFHYLDHRTVDHKFNIITDVHVTSGNVNDSTVYLERLQRQIQTFGFDTTLEAVLLDSGYMTPYICKKTLEMNIFPVINYRQASSTPGLLAKSDFIYDSEQDVYICPARQQLSYYTTNRAGYREYVSAPNSCASCPMLPQCTQAENKQRKIQRHIWEEHKEQVMINRKSPEGEALYRLRAQTIERSFADAKNLHGYRRSRLRGINKMREQSLMTAISQNLKKIARHLARKEAHVGGLQHGHALFLPINTKCRSVTQTPAA
jgi:transposase